MIFSTNPEAIGNYQMRTKEQPVKMPNVSFHTFRCKCCGQPKSINGRKSLGWKAGFQCKDCANE